MRRSWIVAGLVVVTGAVGLAGAGYLRGASRPAATATAPAATAAAPAAIELLPSDLAEVTTRDLRRTLPLTGTLKPANQTVVKAKVAGDLSQLLVREGETVRRGQVIARIDPVEFEWKVKEREAAVASAKASLDLANKTRENNQQLLGKGFISQNAFDSSQSQLEVARGNHDGALDQLTLARRSLEDTYLRASIDGIVSERHAQQGEKMPVDGKVATIVDLSRMELEAPVPSESIGKVVVGQPVSVTVEGLPAALAGKVARINPSTSAGTRSVLIYITFDNPGTVARAGLFAQGQLVLEQRAAVPAVPASALVEQGGRSGLFVITNGRLALVPVAAGLREEAADGQVWVEVRGTLPERTTVIRNATAQYRDGAAVRMAAPRAGAPT
jgi:membrane fusion protein (multidrug efflux system)